MLRRALILLCALFLVGGCAGVAAKAPERVVPRSAETVRLSFAPVVKEVAPAVVSITSRKAIVTRGSPFAGDPFFQFFFHDLRTPSRRIETSLGSGVIIRDDGLVVTNHHVIDGADEIQVVLADRRTFSAKVLWSDPGSDLAFLQLATHGGHLPTASLGDSDTAEVGDLVLAIGNPFGIGQTVTSGIISAKGRTAPELDQDVSFLQTDAAINPGNSGGALVTLDGKVVGINTAIFTRGGGSIGIGFAIPADLVRARLEALGSGRPMTARPWLGAALEPVDQALAQQLGLDRPRGVLVRQVYPKSAADTAGLVAGDVILSVDGVTVDDPAAVEYRLSLKALGDRTRLGIWHRAAERPVEVELGQAPMSPAPDRTLLKGESPLAGVTVANLSPGLSQELQIDMFRRGVVVLAVDPNGPGARLALGRGDIIESVGGRRMASVADLERSRRSDRGSWRIGSNRGGRVTVLTIR
jgi:serine protease Do